MLQFFEMQLLTLMRAFFSTPPFWGMATFGVLGMALLFMQFMKRTKQPLLQDWLVEMARRVARRLPFKQGLAMGLAALFRPRTRGWNRAGAAIGEYVAEEKLKQHRALGLDRLIEAAKGELDDHPKRT